VKPKSRVLVLGCGTGSLAPGLAKDGFIVLGRLSMFFFIFIVSG
jgi:2-polyprenyl-3-methyl-5-hydroxy-6-metoxy-1,4-benzoquinol methylase